MITTSITVNSLEWQWHQRHLLPEVARAEKEKFSSCSAKSFFSLSLVCVGEEVS